MFGLRLQQDEVKKTNEAFARQLGSCRETLHIDSVGLKVYKAYFNSVENICFRQIAISTVDLFVLKW